MKRMLIVGATSAIAEATARLFAADGERIYLVARNADKLRAIVDDLRVRGAAQVGSQVIDVTDCTLHSAMLDKATESLGGLDTVLIAHGTLPDQKACEGSFDATLRELQVNGLSVISLLTHVARQFQQQGRGTIVVISSVAGDRGRQSNYVYGTAKAAVTTFLQGLRNRLHKSGVQVLTVKPGFVDTPMTAGFQKGMLWVKPDVIARGIYKAMRQGRDEVYLPWVWSPIMRVIRFVPERIFKRLSL